MKVIFSKFNGYGADGARPCHKGGSSNTTYIMEQERQQRITDAVNAINAIFDATDRNALYEEQKKTVYDINAQEVERQYNNAERDVRFGLARNGLLGGSVDIDSNAELQRKNNEGLMQAVGMADSAAADLKTTDERNRQSLISMAQSGIDTGTAQSMALQNLNSAAQNAQAERAASSIGGLFDDFSRAYLSSKYYGSADSPSKTGSGMSTSSANNGSYTGMISST